MKTEFVKVLEKLFENGMPKYSTQNLEVNFLLKKSIEILLVVLDYI